MALRTTAFVSVVWGQAGRALVRNKGRSSLTAIGVAIAVAAVVWVVALGREGASRAQSLLRDLGDNLVWVEAGARNSAGVRTGSKSATTLTVGDALAIGRDVPLVEKFSPQVDGSVQLISPTRNWATRSRGIAAAYLPIKRFQMALGDVFTDEDVASSRNVVLLGETVRDRLFEGANPVGQVVRMNGQPFEVVGVLAPKGQSATGQDQDDVVMLPYTTALRTLRAPGVTWLDDIVCSAVAPEAVAPAAEQITALMRERHRITPGADDDFNIRHPEEVVNAQLAASETFSLLLLSVASVSLLVGGIGVMNVMLASVMERTREIGLRRAVGATGAAITVQFLAEAVLLCLFGGALGAIVSVAGCSALGNALGWKLTIPVEGFAVAFGFSVIVGVVFGLIPARRAAKLDPIEALRSE